MARTFAPNSLLFLRSPWSKKRDRTDRLAKEKKGPPCQSKKGDLTTALQRKKGIAPCKEKRDPTFAKSPTSFRLLSLLLRFLLSIKMARNFPIDIAPMIADGQPVHCLLWYARKHYDLLSTPFRCADIWRLVANGVFDNNSTSIFRSRNNFVSTYIVKMTNYGKNNGIRGKYNFVTSMFLSHSFIKAYIGSKGIRMNLSE